MTVLVHGVCALARGAERVIETERPLGADALHSVRQLSLAARLLNAGPDAGARTVALDAAGAANRALVDAADVYLTAFLGHVRTVAAELLQATGEPEDEASRQVRTAGA